MPQSSSVRFSLSNWRSFGAVEFFSLYYGEFSTETIVFRIRL